MPETRVPCPMCGEMIVETAHLCHFCGEKLKGDGIRESGIDAKFVKKFRGQMHGLGGFWILAALVVGGLGTSILLAQQPAAGGLAFVGTSFALFFLCLGIVYLTIGVLTCLKVMPAVYTGLVLTYLSLAGNAISMLGAPERVCTGIFAILICVLIIVQAHRVIGWAKQIRAAGLELSVRPADLA